MTPRECLICKSRKNTQSLGSLILFKIRGAVFQKTTERNISWNSLVALSIRSILLQLPTLKYNYKFAFLLIQFARTRRDLDEKKKVGSSWILAQIIERLKCPWETVGWVFKIFFIFLLERQKSGSKVTSIVFFSHKRDHTAILQ